MLQGAGEVLHITGQVAWDAENRLIGTDDVAAQMEKCIDNIRAIIDAVGGRPDDIVSMTIYFLNRADLPAIQQVRARHFKVGSAPASILIQVPGLVIPEFLIELVPIAVIPRERFQRPRW